MKYDAENGGAKGFIKVHTVEENVTYVGEQWGGTIPSRAISLPIAKITSICYFPDCTDIYMESGNMYKAKETMQEIDQKINDALA